MKKLMLVVGIIIMLTGCKTGEAQMSEGASSGLNLWPIIQVDPQHDRYCVFPFFWGEDVPGEDYLAIFPIWYRDKYSYASPLYAQGEKGARSWWSLPALFTWGIDYKSTEMVGSTGSLLLGLGGWSNFKMPSNAAESRKWWAFPLAQSKWTKDSLNNETKSTSVAAHLISWATCDGKLKRAAFYPLFDWEDNGTWLTLLCGQINHGNYTNTVITPLVGVTSGAQTGGWVFPVYFQNAHADFEEKAALIDSPTLPDSIEVTRFVDEDNQSETFGKSYLIGEWLYSMDNAEVLLNDFKHTIHGASRGWYNQATNTYALTEKYKRGNKLLVNYAYERKVTFDLKSKAKLADEESSQVDFLLWLYQYEWQRQTVGDYTCHRVLWRLFRYESDPKTGTSIDFLFIPVWR